MYTLTTFKRCIFFHPVKPFYLETPTSSGLRSFVSPWKRSILPFPLRRPPKVGDGCTPSTFGLWTPSIIRCLKMGRVWGMPLCTYTSSRTSSSTTVDGWNPTPPGMYETLQTMGKTTNLNWLAGFQPSTVGLLYHYNDTAHPSMGR